MYATLRNSCWAAALLCSPALAWADEPKADEAPKTEAAKPAEATGADDVAKLIKDLDANRFSQRQAATEKLFEVGKAAIPALTETAGQDSREASTRAVDILKRHFQGADTELKSTAKEALEKIAKGGNDASARRAQEALKPPAESNNQPTIGGIQLVPGAGGIQIGGGQIQIQVQGGFGGGGLNAKRISVKNINGVKEIEAVEGDRTVKIKEDANSIKIEETKKKDGKETTEKYEAKNLDELKKNSPQGAKLYEEYAQGNGAIRINAIQLGVPGGAVPVPAVPGIQVIQGQAQLVPAFDAAGGGKEQAEKLKELGKRLDGLKEQVKKLGEGSTKTEELKKALDEIDAAQKQLGELQKQAEAGAPPFEGVEKAAQEALKKIQEDVQKNVDEAKKATEKAPEGDK